MTVSAADSQKQRGQTAYLPFGWHVFECCICRERWMQGPGSKEQTHRVGCSNVRAGDKVIEQTTVVKVGEPT